MYQGKTRHPSTPANRQHQSRGIGFARWHMLLKPTSMLVAAGLWYRSSLPSAHDGSILPCPTAAANALRACTGGKENTKKVC